MFCWLNPPPSHLTEQHQRGVTQVMRGVQPILENADKYRINALQLFCGLAYTAAAVFASATALDEQQHVLCTDDDEAHLDRACAEFRRAMETELKLRREMLNGIEQRAFQGMVSS